MRKKAHFIVHSAVIAALYVVLTHMQNLIFPNSASMAIQFRLSEALCVLAFFTPAAIPGLTIGCFLFNIAFPALPFDFLVGSVATFLAVVCMRQLRRVTIKGFPFLGLLMPALFNAILVGAELSLTAGIGGSFWLNALCVAVGEIGVLFTAGVLLYYTLKSRKLDQLFFHKT